MLPIPAYRGVQILRRGLSGFQIYPRILSFTEVYRGNTTEPRIISSPDVTPSTAGDTCTYTVCLSRVVLARIGESCLVLTK